MSYKSEKPKLQGIFSSYSVNSLHKSRLENFIKRNKSDKSPEKNFSKSKSPVFEQKKEKKRRTPDLAKVGDLGNREKDLANKEAELKNKEKQLRKLTQQIFLNKSNSSRVFERCSFKEEKNTSVPKNQSLTEKVKNR